MRKKHDDNKILKHKQVSITSQLIGRPSSLNLRSRKTALMSWSPTDETRTLIEMGHTENQCDLCLSLWEHKTRREASVLF